MSGPNLCSGEKKNVEVGQNDSHAYRVTNGKDFHSVVLIIARLTRGSAALHDLFILRANEYDVLLLTSPSIEEHLIH